MKEFLFEDPIRSIEERIHISRNNKCYLVLNAENHSGEWPPKLGIKKLPTRTGVLMKDLKKGLYGV